MRRNDWQKWYFYLVVAISLASITLLTVGALMPQSPQAVEGILDLGEWPFGDRVVRLSGEWEFYFGQLLWPTDFSTSKPIGSLQKVPGAWLDYNDVVPQSADRFAAATYRLRVLLPEQDSRYGLKSTSIHASARIIVDGKEILLCGKPGLTREASELCYRPETGYFEVTGPELEIIVQASSEISVASGITQPIFFGSEAAIKRYRSLHVMLDAANITVMVMVLIYLLASSVRSESRSPRLLAAAFSLCTAFKAITQSELLIFQLFPSLSYDAFMRFSSVIMVLQLYLLLKYVDVTFNVPKIKGRLQRAELSIAALFLLYKLLQFLAPQLLELFFLAANVLVIALILQTLLKRKRGEQVGGPLLDAAAVCMVAVIIVNIFTLVHEPNAWALPLETLLLLSLSLYGGAYYEHAYTLALRLNEQLVVADKLKDDFLAEVSHELRTPLHGIMNISYSLLADVGGGPSDSKAEDMLLIHSISKRLTSLVHSLLDHTRLIHGDIELDKKCLDVHGAVAYTVDIFRHMARGRSLTINNLIPPGAYFALADENRLQQILTNLLDNAVKFTPEGNITITSRQSDEQVFVSVTDTGCGMPTTDLATIFQPHSKEQSPAAPNVGLGLGLKICRQLLEAQDGQITAQSALGEGTSITFTLPRATATAAPYTSAMSSPFLTKEQETLPYLDERPEGDMKVRHLILSVDDEYSNLKALSNILTKEGYRVISVTSAQQALTILDGPLVFDLCITDAMMPVMSGVELCRTIRRRYAPLDLPLLFITAHTRPADIEAAFQAGTNDFLGKPFDPQELIARVNSLVHMRKAKEILLAKETAFLQAQIKPHFLFNALNTITSLCYTDASKAGELLTELSVFLRHSVDFESTSAFVTIEYELRLLDAYVAIEKARFGERLTIEFNIDPRCLPYSIPPLTIQPLVENAIRHGLGVRLAGGKVQVDISCREDDNLWVVVTDDGEGFPEAEMARLMQSGTTSRGVGLENINARLISYFGRWLRIKSEPSKGTQVTFCIPARKQ